MNPVITPSNEVTFKCQSCCHTFNAVPERTIDAPEKAHPYNYFAPCPRCQNEASQVYWQVGLYNAHLKATGPRTAAGKSKSASNLDGHPTPEATQHIRFNALKHGASAKTALFFPARPGQYVQCKTCDVDWSYCAQQPACVKRSELVMSFVAAMQSGNTEFLNEMHVLNQANLAALFQDMILHIIQDGAVLKSPAFGFDKDGNCNVAEYDDKKTGKRVIIEEVKANPLLKPLFELLSKNNMSLADLNLTPKVQSDQDIQTGNLKADEDNRESLSQYQHNISHNLSNLKDMIQVSQRQINSDSVSQEYQQLNDTNVIDVKSEDVSGE